MPLTECATSSQAACWSCREVANHLWLEFAGVMRLVRGLLHAGVRGQRRASADYQRRSEGKLARSGMLQGEIEGGTLLERHQLIRARKSDGSQLKPRLAMPRLRKKGSRPPHDGPLRHGPQEPPNLSAAGVWDP